MTRYVIVEFDNDASAEAFVVKINGEMVIPTQPARGFRAIALFAVPRKACECPERETGNTPGARAGGRTIARGEKFGWWVHRGCGRPIHNHHQTPRNLLLEGDELSDRFWTFRWMKS